MKSTHRIPTLVAMFLLLSAVGPPAGAQDQESVLLVHLVYTNGQWSVGPDGVRVLPCPAPNLVVGGGLTHSVIRVKDEAGAVVLEQSLRNPRIRLSEQGSEGPTLLEEASVTLRIPSRDAMRVLEYLDPTLLPEFEDSERVGFEAASEEMQPSLVVDLTPQVTAFAAARVAGEAAPCQPFEYKPDQRANN